jgi:cation:H+ antiporter
MELLLDVVLLAFGFALLLKGADIFVDGASDIARRLRISELIISLTLVAVATSLPETGVSIIAAFSGEEAVSISNIVGSVIFNVCIAFGAMILFMSYKPRQKIISRDSVAMVLAYLLLFIAMVTAGGITPLWGAVFLVAYLIYLYYLYRDVKEQRKSSKKTKETAGSIAKDVAFLLIGFIAIYVGSKISVDSAINIAFALGVSEWAIGATLLAVGTSLPEFAVSLGALRKGKLTMSLGNVIGSNIFDILVALGLSSFAGTLLISFEAIAVDISILLLTGVLVTLMAAYHEKMGRREGFILIMVYVIYLIYLLS